MITAQVDSALRRGFSEASVRLDPETRITDVLASLETLGITATIQDGVLLLAQGQTQMNTSLALRSFSQRPEFAKFFVQEGQHPYQWSKEKKLDYLSKHSAEEYRALVQRPVLEAGLKVLDPNMSRKDYESLTRQERIQFIREYGANAVSNVMAKAAK